MTDELQVIDQGIGSAIKARMGILQDKWLEEGNNLELWTSGFSNDPNMGAAAHRRILLTHWAAQAIEEVFDK